MFSVRGNRSSSIDFGGVPARLGSGAIRTARRPDVGTMDEETRKKLIAESERLNAVPHFAGLSLTPLNVTEAQVDGITKNREYEVVFNGMTVVR